MKKAFLKKTLGGISTAIVISVMLYTVEVMIERFYEIPFERPIFSTIGIAALFWVVTRWYEKD